MSIDVYSHLPINLYNSLLAQVINILSISNNHRYER